MNAAFETLRDLGITGASARAIAARGEFNQALIFYHFGSVTNLLMEAARKASADRVEAYRAVTTDVGSLGDLVEVARRLHRDSAQEGSVAVLTQLMAGASADQELGAAVLDGFEGWIGLVEEAIGRATEGSPLAGLFPARESAYAISALFLGIELMERLDPDRSEAESVFDALRNVAVVVEQALSTMGSLFPIPGED